MALLTVEISDKLPANNYRNDLVMSKKEDDLNLAFANKLVESPEFVSWMLSRTKFRKDVAHAQLLHEEQAIRPAKFWWKHWWCKVPELNADSETDIFLVFQIDEGRQRFALHIENKLANSTFTKRQPESYAFRARHMMNKPRYLYYSDFETVLMAPLIFQSTYRSKCGLFDRYISHEDIANFVPEFGD